MISNPVFKHVCMAAAVAVLGTLPCVGQSGTTQQCPSILVDSVPPVVGRALPAGTFSVKTTIDLRFTVLFPPPLSARDALASGTHVLELRVTGPSRNLYQSLSVPFSADNGVVGSSTTLAGYRWPVNVKPMSAVTHNKVSYGGVSLTLPVAGTAIQDNGLYGKWLAVAYLDGSPTPCGPAATFAITQ